MEFVDPTSTGEYHHTMDPTEKDALKMILGAGPTLYEQMGMSSQQDRFNRSDGTNLGIPSSIVGLSEKMNEFTRLDLWAKINKPQAVKFKDLEAQVNSRITYNLLPVRVRADYIRITDSTVLTSVTVQLKNKDLQFQQKDAVAKALVNMYARITSICWVVNVWEEPVVVETPAVMLAQASKRSSIYEHSVFLAPGSYRLNVVVKDVTGGTMNNYEMALHVPRFEDKLASSSLILADLIEKVATRNIGSGQFVIGDSKCVRG